LEGPTTGALRLWALPVSFYRDPHGRPVTPGNDFEVGTANDAFIDVVLDFVVTGPT
jgi:hypothetical protein